MSALSTTPPQQSRKGLWLFLAFVAVIALWLFSHINSVPRLTENADAHWSQTLNQYQRRADLVPNLVEVVKGYAKHERDVFEQVTEARAKVGQITLPADVTTNPDALKQFQDSQQQLGGALTRLLAVSENYPQLKANENFRDLQAQLEGTENRISVARRDYIEAVKALNIELKTIPGRWIAQWLYPEVQPRANFTVEEAVIKTPQVQFNP